MIFLILLIGILVRFISLNQSLWLDEAINVLATKNFSFLSMITEYAKADFHPPGFFIILWTWTKLFGTSEIFVRIPSVIFGSLTIYVIYLIGCKLHSKTLGLFSAFLLALNPLHIYYSQEARMYALACLAVSINIFILIKLIKKEKLYIFILILSNLSVLLTDYVAYLIFPAQFIFLLINKDKEAMKKWFNAIALSILLFIWWLPTFLSQLNVGSVTADKLPAWKFIVGGFDIKSVPLTFVKFIIGRISYPDKFIYAIILLPICILFLYLLIRGIKSVTKFGKNLLLTWIIIPVTLATIISFVVPIYGYFRMIFTLPAFIILIALGILSFRAKVKYIFMAAVIFIEFVSSSTYLFNPMFQREDWKGLVKFIESQNKLALTLFESPGTMPPFDYYANKNDNVKGALLNFPIKNENGLKDLSVLQNRDIYLVNYLVEISDPNRLVEKKLNELGYKKINTKNFYGVGFVFHYVK